MRIAQSLSYTSLILMLAAVSPVEAQDRTSTDSPVPPATHTPTAAPTPAGPSLAAASVGVQRLSPSHNNTPLIAKDNVNVGQNVALMIVGGAGIVVGSMIGGDGGTLIMISSGVIGLVGLYRYLQ